MPWFRHAAPTTASALLARTAVQVVIFWGVFLFVLPPLIARLDRPVADAWQVPHMRPLAAALFAVASTLGLASAVTMVSRGRGTPLPIDGPRHLVVSGPYAWVRNPMAVAGLTQGAAVALWLRSPLVLVYVVAGGVLWHWFVRPLEEAHLMASFGDDYRAYRARVPLWLPRRAGTPHASESRPAVLSAPQDRESREGRVGTIRARFFEAGGFAPDGGSSARWVKYPVGRVHLVLPNVSARRRALPLHDLHHLATGYDTSWTGEAEIAAWELGAGRHGYVAPWVLNIAAFTIGLVIAPRRLWRAFVRGRSGTTLYRHHWRDEYLDWRLSELQAFLGADARPRVATPGDAVLFAAFTVPGLTIVGIAIAAVRAFG